MQNYASTDLQLTPNGKSKYSQINLAISSELMKNYAAGFPVDPGQRFSVAQDGAGNPMIFSIGTDHVLYVTLRSVNSKTGWEQIQLSAGLGAGRKVQAFELSQDLSGKLTLALALESTSIPGTSDLYLTAALSNDTTQVDWHNFTHQWVLRPCEKGALTVLRILMGTNDDNRGAPLLIVATQRADEGISHYRVNADTSAVSTPSAALWIDFPLPENATELIDLAIGSHPMGRGTFALYRVGNDVTLEFTTLPVYHHSYNYRIPVPPGAKALAVAPGTHNYSDLYIVGEGLFLLKAEALYVASLLGSSPIPLVPSSTLADVHEVVVCKDTGGNTCVWALSGGGELFYMEQTSGQTTWSMPLPMRSNVTQVAALRNNQRYANEVFVVDANRTLGYLWQDPTTTLWKESDIPLYSTSDIITFNSYVTQLTFQDVNHRPIADIQFNLTSSEWTYLTINDTTHVLDAAHPLPVTPDMRGAITITNAVTTLSTPMFHLQADFLDQVVDVNPAAKIQQGLAAIKSGDDLMNATTQDGQSLLQGSYRNQNQANQVAQALQQLTTLGSSLPQSTPSSGSRVAPAAITRTTNAPAINKIQVDALPKDYSWGMKTGPESMQFAERQEMATLLSAGGTQTRALTLDGFSLGNLLEYLRRIVPDSETVNFLIQRAEDEVIHFFCYVGDQVFKVVLTSLEQVLGVINWVLEKTLGIDLDKLIQWLGFFFEWEDIKVTHAVIKNLTNQFMRYIEGKFDQIIGHSSTFFASLRQILKTVMPIPDDVARTNIPNTSTSMVPSIPEEIQKAISFLTTNPAGNYSLYQLLYGGITDFDPKSQMSSDSLSVFIDTVALPEINAIVSTSKQVLTDLIDAFQGGKLDIGQVTQKIGADVVLGILDSLEKVVVGILNLIKGFFEQIRTDLLSEIQIPFLSGLYKMIVGSEMSILDGLALLLAIPTTTIYKIITQKAPFSDTTYGMDTRDYTSLLKGLDLSQNPFMRTESVMRSQGMATVQAEERNQLSETGPTDCIIKYSELGALVAALVYLPYTILDVQAGIMQGKWEDAKGEVDKAKILKDLKALSWTQVALASIIVVTTLPLQGGPEIVCQWVLWGLSIFDVIKSIVAIIALNSQSVVELLGGLEIGEGVVTIGLASAILALQRVYNQGQNLELNLLGFFSTLVNGFATGGSGITKLDVEPDTKAIAFSITCALALAGVLLDIPWIGESFRLAQPVG